MSAAAAKLGDRIVAVDIHMVLVPPSPSPVPLPHPFSGLLNGNLSTNVRIMGQFAATAGSTAVNVPPHIAQGIGFATPPSNQGRVIQGSATVNINGKPAARMGDVALTCNDPVDVPIGKVIAFGTVMIG